MITFNDFLKSFNNIWHSPISPIYTTKSQWLLNQIQSNNIIVVPDSIMPTYLGMLDRKSNKIFIPKRLLNIILKYFQENKEFNEIEVITYIINHFANLK